MVIDIKDRGCKSDFYIPDFYSMIFPSIDIVTTLHGINLPLCLSAFLTAFSIPPQHGTSILTTVTI